MTIGDKIRSMSDRELTLLFTRHFIQSCLLMLKYPGAGRKWILGSAKRVKEVFAKHLEADESEHDWSWLNRGN